MCLTVFTMEVLKSFCFWVWGEKEIINIPPPGHPDLFTREENVNNTNKMFKKLTSKINSVVQFYIIPFSPKVTS